ncbi:MAG: hypothetical protein Tsb0020_38650 [Haliangiales bacterium]
MNLSRITFSSIGLPSLLLLSVGAAACGGDDAPELTPVDPASAEQVEVDRFSAAAGNLMVRTAENGLPGPNQPINFDQGPFITRGFGPDGSSVLYYNFDVQPTAPAPIFAFFRESTDTPVEGQLNVIDVIPGDAGYNDFWLVNKVYVPDDYKANSITSFEELIDAGFAIETTDLLVNCPVVPAGSTASLRGGGESNGLHQGWYKGGVVNYFTFEEAGLKAAGGSVPLSPIYVTFVKNPSDDPSSGPASGFVTEADGEQTHNVLATLPGDAGYSPLWSVVVYDNQGFDSVVDLESVQDAAQVSILATGAGTVNCPVVAIE